MEIKLNKNLVDFTPANEQEAAQLEKLWRLLIGCNTDSKSMVPVGEFVPGLKNTASFYVEGMDAPAEVPEATEAYSCSICNRYIYLKPGEAAPVCCGIPMQLID
jgi:hypothetical protein